MSIIIVPNVDLSPSTAPAGQKASGVMLHFAGRLALMRQCCISYDAHTELLGISRYDLARSDNQCKRRQAVGTQGVLRHQRDLQWTAYAENGCATQGPVGTETHCLQDL